MTTETNENIWVKNIKNEIYPAEHDIQGWIEVVKIIDNKNIYPKDSYGMFSVNTHLYAAPDSIRLNRDVVMTALLEGQEFVWNIDNTFKHDKNFIMDLLKNPLYKVKTVYSALSETLRKDEEVFRLCVRRNDDFSRYNRIHETLLSNIELLKSVLPDQDIMPQILEAHPYEKELIEAGIELYPTHFSELKKRSYNHIAKNITIMTRVAAQLEYGNRHYPNWPEKTRQDKGVIYAFLSKTPEGLEYIPQAMQHDKEEILTILNKVPDYATQTIYQKINDTLKEDMDIIEFCLKRYPSTVRYLPDMFRQSPEFATYTIEKYNTSLSSFPESIRDNEMAARSAVLKSAFEFQYVSKRLKATESFACFCLDNIYDKMAQGRNTGDRLRQFHPDLSSNEKVAFSAIRQNATEFQLVSEHLKNQPEFALRCVHEFGIDLKLFPETVRSNYELVSAAIHRNGEQFQYASGEAHESPELLAIARQTTNSMVILSDKMKNDYKLVMEFLELDINNYKHFSNIFLDKHPLSYDTDIGVFIMEKDPKSFAMFNEKLKENWVILRMFYESPHFKTSDLTWEMRKEVEREGVHEYFTRNIARLKLMDELTDKLSGKEENPRKKLKI